MSLYYKINKLKRGGKESSTPELVCESTVNFILADGSIVDNPTAEQILAAGYTKIDLPEKPTEVVLGKEWQLILHCDGTTLTAKYESM